MGALSVFIVAGEHAGSKTLTISPDDSDGAVTGAGAGVLMASRRPPAHQPSRRIFTGRSRSRYRQIQGLTAAVLALVFFVSAGGASTSTQGCLDFTSAQGLRTSAILQGLDITPDQKREVRGRLSSYNSIRGYEGLDGIGLTTEQIETIQKRIDAQVQAASGHPLGWPCAPFKHRTKVVSFVRAKLVSNGFRPAMSFRAPSARQLQFSAIQDGVPFLGVIAKTGAREITVRLTTTRSYSGGGTYKFAVPFDA